MKTPMYHGCERYETITSRRGFIGRLAGGLGAAAFASLAARDTLASTASLGVGTHFPAKAKRVIYLFQSGAPSQIELFDDKPLLRDRNGQDLPASVRGDQRLTGMTSGQATFPLAGVTIRFRSTR